ncbi:PfkB family carbohydrate kinase [Ruania alba]|uniref:Sugar or nucleoside kinase, ribokinase family n=1 Tax=Ruania alba TaxID=648782 RepID=A0A1H5EDY5_9MICO|nr:PfkB family carbohydrate kinase [Ruania alba]SED89309.1 Sugar or nucleoside kinase, ribokinase family [Ruania alba]
MFTERNVMQDGSGRVVCCGLTTLDVTQVVDRLPGPNEKIVATEARLAVGGPAANAALTAAALGAPTTLVTALGSGPLAELARAELSAGGVLVHDLAHVAAPPISTVLVTAGTGERAVASANLSRSSTPPPMSEPELEQVLDGARAVLVDGHLIEPSLALCAAGQRRGIPTLLDGGSHKLGLVDLLPHVNAALLSDDFTWPGESDPLAAVAARGPVLVAQSRGGAPIRVRTDEGTSEIPVPSVPAAEIVDTLGAGDVLHGAWAHAVADGASPIDAIAAGAEVASRSVRFPGALGWAGQNIR